MVSEIDFGVVVKNAISLTGNIFDDKLHGFVYAQNTHIYLLQLIIIWSSYDVVGEYRIDYKIIFLKGGGCGCKLSVLYKIGLSRCVGRRYPSSTIHVPNNNNNNMYIVSPTL